MNIWRKKCEEIKKVKKVVGILGSKIKYNLENMYFFLLMINIYEKNVGMLFFIGSER